MAQPILRREAREMRRTRAQQRAAGTKKTALFDIVNRKQRGAGAIASAATHSVPAERAPRRVLSVPLTNVAAGSEDRRNATARDSGNADPTWSSTQGTICCAWGWETATSCSPPTASAS